MTSRALVLGGGGVTGIAWMTGLLAGLAEAGTDLTSADLVVGTSAGSVVGAQILSGPVEGSPRGAAEGTHRGRSLQRWGVGAILGFVFNAWWPGDERVGRARLGRAAMKARTVPEAERMAVFRAAAAGPVMA